MVQLNQVPGLLSGFSFIFSTDGLLMPDVYIYLSIRPPPSLSPGGRSAGSVKSTLFIDAF